MPDEGEKSYKERNLEKANAEKEKMTKGMIQDRPCTDKLCCLVFLVFIVATLGVSFWAFSKGDPRRILTPFDSDGNACGKKDQCSVNGYAWPQGTPCPVPKAGEKFTEFTIPAEASRNAGEKVKIPAPRDFTDYKLKYFPIQSKLYYEAVCVKACPATKYTAKEESGACQRTDKQLGVDASQQKITNTEKGYVPPDFVIDTDAGKDLAKCQNSCFSERGCSAYEVVDDKCRLWQKYKGKMVEAKDVEGKVTYTYVTVPEIETKEPKGGDGTAKGKCYLKSSDGLTAVDYLKNDDIDGSVPALPNQDQGQLFAFFPTKEQFNICLPTEEVGLDILNKFLKSMDENTGMVKYLVQLGEVWQIMVGMAFATVVISLFYIYLLKCITKPLLYTSMLLILILFLLAGAWSWMKKDDYDPVIAENNHNYCKYGAFAAWGIAGIYLIFICCCWKNISLGASIMEAAADFVTSTIRVIWLPIGGYALCVPYLCYWVVSAAFLYSVGEPYFKDMSFIAEIKWDDQTTYLWWFFLFALLWSIAFLICVQQFAIAATACQWYWGGQGKAEGSDAQTHGVSVFKSVKWACWDHCGSIAFGSFIIAVVQMMRIIFEYLVHQFEKVGPKENCIYKAAKCYIRYVLWCLEQYVKFITKNAFIQIALKGQDFCAAAWGSFCLVMRNAGRFTASTVVGMIMMLLGKGTIMGLSCYLTFVVVSHAAPDIEQPLVPAFVILLISYLVGSFFLSIFSFSATTILHCFILDEDTGGAKITPASLVPFLKDNDNDYDKNKDRYEAAGGNASSGTGNQGGKEGHQMS